MIDKTMASAREALADLRDGASIMISGFGDAGSPHQLIDALVEHGATDLTVISNNAGSGETGIAALVKAGRVRKVICSFPRMAAAHPLCLRAQEVSPHLWVHGTRSTSALRLIYRR